MSDKDYDELHSDLDEEVDEDAFHIGARLDPPQARLYSTQELHSMSLLSAFSSFASHVA